MNPYFSTNGSAFLGSAGSSIGGCTGGSVTRQRTAIARGAHEYGEQDLLGQAGLTEAMLDWLDDDEKVHPTHLEQSLAEFNAILGIYHSALTHEPVELPFDPPDGLIESLKKLLL